MTGPLMSAERVKLTEDEMTLLRVCAGEKGMGPSIARSRTRPYKALMRAGLIDLRYAATPAGRAALAGDRS